METTIGYKVGIMGRNGFIGSALAERFKYDTVYSYPRKDLRTIYFFGSPSSNIMFEQNMEYAFRETINSFISVIQYCKENKIHLVYPSSATVYNKNTAYARCKSVLEEIHMAYGGDVLGLRIFAGYGATEGHKGDYASIVYQFCKQMQKGERPVIFGDGTQTRDFIYVDDIVDNLLLVSNQTGIVDIGTGVNTSFNEVVGMINAELGTNIAPIYVNRPTQYVLETVCHNAMPIRISLKEGIKKILGKEG